MKKGSAYITGLIFIFLTVLIVAAFLRLTSVGHRNVTRDKWNITAFHLAEAGIDDAIWAIKNLEGASEWESAGWTAGATYTKTVSSFTNSTGEIIGDYSVIISAPASSTPVILSTGYCPEMNAGDKRERSVEAKLSVPDSGNIKAAVTTNYETTTLGSEIIDGRNHDLNGNVIPGTGTSGIHTTSSYSRGGASTVGGTSDSTDYEPSQSYPPSIVTTYATWAEGYPATPDEVMDYEEGVLRKKAQSGSGGSQFVTNPSSLITPLSGVTYVEITGTWNVDTFDLSGAGVFVVHSPAGNTACIKNLNVGTFKGLVIADNVLNIHNTIIGAVFTLSSNPSDGQCIGNGSGQILYSADAISDAFDAAGGATLLTWQEK